MKTYIFIFMTLLISSCRYTGDNINNKEVMKVSNDYGKFIKSEQLLDSLLNFIETTDIFPNDSGKVFYTVDIALHKRDTLVSLWSYDSVLEDGFPFFDSRFILELAKNPALICEYDWMKLYERITESPYEYLKFGAKDISDKQVLALTLRSNLDVTDIMSFDSLDVIKFGQYLKYKASTLSSDRSPDMKIYRYRNNKGLELLYRRYNKGKEETFYIDRL